MQIPDFDGIFRVFILGWLFPLQNELKSCIFALFRQNQRNVTISALKSKSVCNFFATSVTGPSDLTTPLMIFDDFLMVNSWNFQKKHIRNWELEHRFCKIPNLMFCVGFCIWTYYPHSKMSSKRHFFAISSKSNETLPFLL